MDTVSLLMRAASPNPDEVSQVATAALLRSSQDLDSLLMTASRLQMLPILARNISQIADYAPPNSQAQALQSASMRARMRYLRIKAELAHFQKACIDPHNIDHVHLKGVSLSERYFPVPSDRICRDIDLLVSETGFEYVVRAAITQGYQALSPKEGKVITCEDALLFQLRYNATITVRGHSGISIELHRRLNDTYGLFSEADFFQRQHDLQLADTRIPVPDTNLLFCYICFHATRHIWSRLHWIADLHAVSEHPSFERTECLALARTIGIDRLISVCLEVKEVLKDRLSLESASGDAQRMLKQAHDAMTGGIVREKQLIVGAHTFGLPLRFLGSGRAKRRAALNHLAAGLVPDASQYENLRLPRPLWFGYVPLKAGRSLYRGAGYVLRQQLGIRSPC